MIVDKNQKLSTLFRLYKKITVSVSCKHLTELNNFIRWHKDNILIVYQRTVKFKKLSFGKTFLWFSFSDNHFLNMFAKLLFFKEYLDFISIYRRLRYILVSYDLIQRMQPIEYHHVSIVFA